MQLDFNKLDEDLNLAFKINLKNNIRVNGIGLDSFKAAFYEDFLT